MLLKFDQYSKCMVENMNEYWIVLNIQTKKVGNDAKT